MPIRIREVHFKAIVHESDTPRRTSVREPSTQDAQALVATCVEQIMRKLKEKNER